MADILIKEGQYDQTEHWIPINKEILQISDDLMDDYLSMDKHIKKTAERKKLILTLHPSFIFPPNYGWNTQEEDGKDYLVLYVDNVPHPPMKLKTGHIYFGSYMEGAEDTSNCGTCDGARCESCREVYRDDDGKIHNYEKWDKQ